ncbi:MAG TPA: GMC family oxidoreductase [Thermoanaerobaculia bacterium]|nr:GMC family oxidoreductase [Thermoanaerobaculia bacterium]
MSAGAEIPNLVRGRDIGADRILDADVAIVGSGPGGSIAAYRLAAAGARVVVLEEGGYHTRPEFRMQEEWSYPTLYQDHANRATDDLSITVLQGRSVGGGTTVNWTTSLRTPPTTLDFWKRARRVEGVTAEALAPHWDEVERRLNVHTPEEGEINENNRALLDGAKRLGYGFELLPRNVSDCVLTGMCGLGCPVDAKQAMHLTYLPDAAAHGAVIFANCRVRRLTRRGRRVTEAAADVLDESRDRPAGPTLTVRARTFILSAGAINTPRLLQRSGLPDPYRIVGRRTWLHPTLASAAHFDRKIEPYFGAPQTVGSHHFAIRPGRIGFFLETPPAQPMLAGLAHAGFGPEHRRAMKELPNTAVLIALLIDGFLDEEHGGTVGERGGGRLSFRYDRGPALAEAMREAMKTMARIHLAAGAREVVTFHEPPLRLRTERDVARIDEASVAPNRCGVFTAHQMGGAPMGEDPGIAVVDSRLKHHFFDNLYVMDGSVFPTSLGVNPQISILGLSSLAASALAKAG